MATTDKYICDKCGWIYDPEKQGKAFSEQPDSYKCPKCKVNKKRFSIYDDIEEKLLIDDIVLKYLKSVKEETEEVSDEEKDADKIVGIVKSATNAGAMNKAVEQAGAMYKLYGPGWLKTLEKKLNIDIKSDTVEKFIKYTKNFSEKLTHLR